MNDEKVKDKFEASEKETIEGKVKETEEWLSSNQEAETEKFEEKQKELENMFNPIMAKIYQSAGGQGMPGGMGGMPGGMGGGMPNFQGQTPPGGNQGPEVDQVD